MVLTRSLMAALLTLILGSQPAVGDDAPLTLSLSMTAADTEQLLAGGDNAWRVPPSPIHLNRTPPLYETDPRDDGTRTVATVQIQKRDTSLYIRLVWLDSTVNAPASVTTYADAGETHVYKQHTDDIGAFADAACVMIPANDALLGALPSLMMGDQTQPVALYYWRNGDGFREMAAAGRATTQATGKVFQGSAKYENRHWYVVFEIPARISGTPVAFAIWDGSREHRDGLKFYSLWYYAQ